MFYIKSGVFNSGEFKNDRYLHFRVSPTPARAPPGGGGGRGGGLEGSLIPYYQKSCVISILGFSLVGYSKMILIFMLWYSQPPQGHPRGGGAGSLEGGWVPHHQKSCFISIYGFSIVENIFIFILGVPHPPQGRSRRGRGRGPRGGWVPYHQKSCVLLILGFQ